MAELHIDLEDEVMYSSLFMPKDHPDYHLVCVYEELCRESYLVVAKAQQNECNNNCKKKDLLRSITFWRDVLGILQEHLAIAQNVKLSEKVKQDMQNRILMVEKVIAII